MAHILHAVQWERTHGRMAAYMLPQGVPTSLLVAFADGVHILLVFAKS